MYSIWLTSSEHDREIYNLIQRFADEEGQDAFIPHVTLVTQISTQEKAAEILNQIFKNKCSVLFDQISVGNTYFQKLFLESSDNSYFFKTISNIQGWPSLWVPHLSLYYGDELPKSFDLGELNKLIPVALTFDTIAVYKTGPKVSEWKEITTLYLD